MSNDEEREPEQAHDEDEAAEGQVSEVGRLDPAEADTPIQPDQATAGAPEAESGRPDEGTAGPNAVPDHEARSKGH